MKRVDWSALRAVFEAAWSLGDAGREALLDEMCGGDPALRLEAEKVVKAFDAERIAQHDATLRASTHKRKFGAWETVQLIGRGGMAEVWLARRADGQHEQRAALKLISPYLVSPEYIERFRRERQLLARLEHPNIPRVFDSGVSEDGEPYLVMEYVEGKPLNDYCDSNNLSMRDRVGLMLPLCSAVASAHGNLILHRDIKPSNVLVAAAGTLKLLDFGAGRELGGDSLQTQAPVTPAYASPEQLRGEAATTVSDVYGLGATLFSLITGEAPYGSNRSSYDVMRSVLDEAPPLPSAIAAGTPHDLNAIVTKAMDKNPARRYVSAERLSADIQRFLDRKPIEARALTWAYRSERFAQRHRLGVGLVALLIVSLATGVALVAREAKIAREQRVLAERRFNDVRQLAHTFLFDFHDAIKNLPGATPARRLVVEKALLYLNSLSTETDSDPSLERELVEAYLRVGDVQGSPGISNLGDTAGALDSYGRALTLTERAARREPHTIFWQRQLLRVHTGLGDILAARNDPTAGLPHYSEAARIVESIPPPDSRDLAARFDVVNVYLALGDCLGNPGLPNVGDPSGAKDAYGKAQRLAEAIAAAVPGNQRARRFVGLIEMRMGDVEMGVGDVYGARASYESATKIMEDVVSQDPRSPATLLVLGNVTGKVGRALEAVGHVADALAKYRKASEIERRLMDADPKNEQNKNSYALSLRASAGLLAKSGESAKALALDREALEIFQQLLAADPRSARRQALYAQTLAAIGGLVASNRHETGRKEEARRAYRQAMDIFKALAGRGAASPEDLSNYAEHLMTCPLPEFVNPGQALEVSQRVVELTHGSQPAYLDQLARAFWASGNAASAAAAERRAASLWSESSPQRHQAQLMLAKFELSVNR